MEDLDLAEVCTGKVCKAWKPYGPDLGIEALDKLFILADDPAAASTDGEEKSGESEDDEESGSGSESREDVEMGEVVNTMEASDA